MTDDDVNRSHEQYTANNGQKQQHSVSDEAISFLEQLRPGGPWVLTAITPDGPTITITAHTAAEIDSFVCEHNGKRNQYYRVNPTRMPMSRRRQRKTSPPLNICLVILTRATMKHQKLPKPAI